MNGASNGRRKMTAKHPLAVPKSQRRPICRFSPPDHPALHESSSYRDRCRCSAFSLLCQFGSVHHDGRLVCSAFGCERSALPQASGGRRSERCGTSRRERDSTLARRSASLRFAAKLRSPFFAPNRGAPKSRHRPSRLGRSRPLRSDLLSSGLGGPNEFIL